MTSIDTLEISGVRSFDPNPANRQLIKFHKPLTVILGKNGAGKTTIIESLLNGTTGKFPPGCGTERSSFVYDPKVVGENQVKAQIRLTFTARDGALCRVIRSYEVTAAKAKRTDKPKFAALDTAIAQQDVKTGLFAQSNFNGTEADVRIRDLMGLSTAVLEHVVFCHQEDCNWPLGSASEVKTNFDAIFAATRYVNALESLQKNRKKFSDQLKDHERTLVELREHRIQAVELREGIQKKEEEIRLMQMRSKSAEPQIQQLKAAAAAIDSIRQTVEALTIDSVQLQGRIMEKEAAVKKMALPRSAQTLAELIEIRRNFNNHMLKLEKDCEAMEGRMRASDSARRAREGEVNDLRNRVAELQRDEAHHKKLCSQLQEIVGHVTNEFVLGESHADERALRRAQEIIQQSVDKATEVLRLEDKDHAAQVEQLSTKLNETLRAMDAESKERELKERQATLNMQRHQELRREIDSIACSDDTIRSTEQSVLSLEKHLAAAVALRQQGQQYLQAEALNKAVEAKNKEIASLRLELVERKKHCQQETQIPFLRVRIEERKARVASVVEKLVGALKQLGRDPKSSDLSAVSLAIEQYRSQKSEALQQVDREQRLLDRDVSTAEQMLAQRREELGHHELELQKHTSLFVTSVGDIGVDAFELKLKELDELQLKHCRHVSSIESMARCYDGFVSTAKQEHMCVVCKRGLSDSALADFVRLNEDRQKSTPEQIEKAKRDAKKVQDMLQKLKAMEPHVNEIRRIRLAIPSLKSAVRQLMEEVATKKALLGDTQNKRKRIEEEEHAATQLFTEASALNSVSIEIDAMQRELSIILQQLQRSAAGNGISPQRTLEELEKAYDTAMEDHQHLSAQLQELQRRHDGAGTDELSLQQQLNTTRATLLELQAAMKRRNDVESMMASLQQEISEHRQRLATIAQRRTELQATVDKHRGALDRLQATWQQRESVLRTQVTEATQNALRLKALMPAAEQFWKQGIAGELQKVRELLRASEQSSKAVEDETDTLSKQIQSIRQVLSEQHRQYSSLNDHIQCLELEKAVEEDRAKLTAVQKEMDELKGSKLNGIESLLDASAASEPVSKVRELIQRRISELERIRAHHEGNMEAMQKELEHLTNKLSSERYNMIDRRYNTEFMKLQTLEFAVSDIDKYVKALDKAVQTYHQDKIQQVNGIIAELWRQIYRGSDIDTIEVKSEVDGENGGSGTSKKNYNYRVIMKRGAHEIDMRAKCSAGQKVLASVVIRVALSEAFSCDCGILALDEPTTNLDEDNARSLAEALRDLIESRRSIKGFQLIVITHDEQFVRALGSQSVDNFYFVHKDREGAFSRIEEKSFDQLFA